MSSSVQAGGLRYALHLAGLQHHDPVGQVGPVRKTVRDQGDREPLEVAGL
jgi:hypothetical protein